MRSTHVLTRSLFSLAVVVCVGCDHPQPGDPATTAESSHEADLPPIARLGQDKLADASRSGRNVTNQTIPINARSSRKGQPSEATELLDAMISAYRGTTSYSDDGFVLLRYRQGDQVHEDRAPLAVKFQRNDRIKLIAYGAELAIQNGHLRAKVQDPATRNFDNQVVDLLLDRTPFALTDIYSEPTVTHFATAGLGGPSPQLELLLAQDPLSGLFEGNADLKTLAATDIDGMRCAGLQVSSDSLVYQFWMDVDSKLLRRVVLPPESAGLSTDASVSEVQLSIELPNAKFATSETTDWQISSPPGEIAVKYLVPPPPPIVSALLGKRVPSFEISSADKNFVVRSGNAADQTTVLLWVADHLASRSAARELQKIADDRVAQTNDTRFVIVMAEPSVSNQGASSQLVRSWNVGLPVVDDLQAVGRDVFDIREAPSLAVLTSDGVLQWFQPRVGPDIAVGIPALLNDLASGKKVGQELVQQHQIDMQTYQQLVDEARSRPREPSAL